MPVYTFRCDNCDREFDQLLTLAELEEYNTGYFLVDCPDDVPNLDLPKHKVKKLMTATRFRHFSWYQWSV